MADHRSIAIEQEATIARLDRALGHLFAERGMTYTATPTYHKDAAQLGLSQLKHVTAAAEQLVGHDTLNPAARAAAAKDTAMTQTTDQPEDVPPPEGDASDADGDTEPTRTDAARADDSDASGHTRTMDESLAAVETLKTRGKGSASKKDD